MYLKGLRHRFQGTLRTVGSKQFISGVAKAKDRQTDSTIAGLWREEIRAPVAEVGFFFFSGWGFPSQFAARLSGAQAGSRKGVRKKVHDHQYPSDVNSLFQVRNPS